jgi:hypothetical protein
MMWKEFEELAGYEVSFKTYNEVIEPMYMALPDSFTKQDFVKMLDKKAFALPTRKQMVKEMKSIAQFIFDNCGLRSYHDEEERLDKLAKEYAERFFGIDWAHDIETYVYCTRDYAYCGTPVERGCTYPVELVIGRGNNEYERIRLVA